MMPYQNWQYFHCEFPDCPNNPKLQIHAWNLAEDLSALIFVVVSPNLFLLDIYINKSKELGDTTKNKAEISSAKFQAWISGFFTGKFTHKEIQITCFGTLQSLTVTKFT